MAQRKGTAWKSISIHALREEGDRTRYVTVDAAELFLSTPSARRATCGWPLMARCAQFLSTPSARRATSLGLDNYLSKPFLSTPSARRATSTFTIQYSQTSEFLSTPSARRATCLSYYCRIPFPISIHALREEGDRLRLVLLLLFLDFYPRPPRGGRLATGIPSAKVLHFYPRPPRGGRPDSAARW